MSTFLKGIDSIDKEINGRKTVYVRRKSLNAYPRQHYTLPLKHICLDTLERETLLTGGIVHNANESYRLTRWVTDHNNYR